MGGTGSGERKRVFERPVAEALWGLIDGHRLETEAASMAVVMNLPVLKRILETTDKAVLDAQGERSRALQRAAIVDDDWEPYIADLHAQGEIYAALGMRFSDWYPLLAPMRAILVPVMLARPDGPALLEAFQVWLDRAMGELANAYVAAKEKLVRRTEAQRDAYVTELERSNAELDAFAYVASHDLKAPLRDIDTLSQWIVEDAREALPEGAARHLERLRDRVARMEGLLEGLLGYSRAGRKQDPPERFAVADAVASALALVGTHPGRTIAVVGDWGEIHAPRAPFELVVRNLVGNALKHHDRPDGAVRVGGGPAADGRIEVWVEDDGPGIPAKFQERVFLMFQTLRPRDEVEGSGMGLAIVKKVVGALGGRVVLQSPVEGSRGARFTFTWPRKWPADPTP